MKYYLIYIIPYGAFYKTFRNNWDYIWTSGSGYQFPHFKAAWLCCNSIIHNENNKISIDDLEIHEYTCSRRLSVLPEIDL
jgi:hypothetical protein